MDMDMDMDTGMELMGKIVRPLENDYDCRSFGKEVFTNSITLRKRKLLIRNWPTTSFHCNQNINIYQLLSTSNYRLMKTRPTNIYKISVLRYFN